jgi:hypothetical protein
MRNTGKAAGTWLPHDRTRHRATVTSASRPRA